MFFADVGNKSIFSHKNATKLGADAKMTKSIKNFSMYNYSPKESVSAVENGEGLLDKGATSYDDIFDAFRMSLQFYQ
jgi:hypothetical protein